MLASPSRLTRLAALLVVSLAAAVVRVSAQDPEKDAARPGLEENRQIQSTRAADDALKLNASGEDVTYEQVLADPDNLDLNYRFARAQVRKGDLKGAAATLERMLLIEPNRPQVRLFYAVVLYRLDNTVEAKRELDLLAAEKLPGALGEEVVSYQKLVDARTKKNHITVRAGLGFQYDTNRNAAPANGERLFGDVPIPLSLASQRRDDTSVLFLGGADYRRAVGNGQELFGSFNYFKSEQTLVKVLNLAAFSLQGGAVLHRGRDSLTPSLVWDHVLLAQTSYLRDRGVDLRYEHKLGKRGDLYVQVHDVYQDFAATAVVPTADERDGIQIDALFGGDYVLTPVNRIGAAYQRTLKRAGKPYNAFDRNGLLLNDIWLLGKGTFLLANAALDYDMYRDPDVALSRKLRRDTTIRASLTYGVPLQLVHKSLQDFVMTFTYEYYQAMSTVENFSYTNDKIGTLLTYKFDLGF